MAVTENTYIGDGTTVLFSFTFPYLENSDIKVSVGGTLTTAYTLANATTIQFNSAPVNGAAIRIYRKSSNDSLAATFYPGSAIRSQDLNNNFTKNLYVVQETERDTSSAVSTANTALTTANSAVTTANSASASAASAVSTANTASNNAATAVSTANTASSTANSASSQATSAVNTANTALTAVSQALNYTPVANVAAIPANPSNGTAVRVLNSTGIESFSPLSGRPAGFVGNSALNVEIYYNGTQATWIWTRYVPGDPDTRYALAALASANILLGNGSGVATGVALTGDVSITNAGVSTVVSGTTTTAGKVQLTDSTSSTSITTAATPNSVRTAWNLADAAMPKSGGTFTGNVTFAAGQAFPGNANTATALATPRNIQGVAFDGTSNITVLTAGTGISVTGTAVANTGVLSVNGSTGAITGLATLASPTFTGTVTIPAGASISGYAALATAQTFTAAQRGTVSALTSAATVTPDFAVANNWSLTLANNVTLANPTNLTAGQSGSIVITQAAAGGPYTVSFGAYWKFPGGTAPTKTTTASSVCVVVYYVESATRITARMINDVK